MKKMLESSGARVLAFILCCAFGLLTVGCVCGFAYVSFEPGMGAGDQRDFLGSEFARDYARSQAWNVIDHAVRFADVSYDGEPAAEYFEEPQVTPMPAHYTSQVPVVDPDRLYLPDPAEGYSCVVRDSGGAVIADTRVENSRLVEYGDEQYYDYTVESYINLPVARNTELYGYVTLYDTLYNFRTAFLPAGIAAGLLTIALFVFLMAAAGRTPEGVRLGGLHRWPLEIYLGILVCLAGGCIALMAETGHRSLMRYLQLYGVLYALLILGAGVCALLGCMTLAARFRSGKWWENTVTFFCLKWAWRAARWCWNMLRRICGGMGRGAARLVRALPLTWKGALAYCAFVLANFLLSINVIWNGGGFLVPLFLLDAAGLLGVIWIAVQLRKLQEAGRALAAGDLSVSVDTGRMLPVLREHAENLGAVSLGMTRAVNERMKSERFKTELITNVSHDLKTPLTSIVSYVDLLKKEPIDNEKAREYIDVLDRQSQRLKKLTTDLVDASKASSGVLTVNLEQVDVGELLRQSAGEYAERFAAARLTPVLNAPETGPVITADGRLLWRVLDNLLTNVVKYALPGTRVYLDVTKQEGKTALSLKNISSEPLNIPAEELMERFVRGDASRSSDGSGLGLSIARSLTELIGAHGRPAPADPGWGSVQGGSDLSVRKKDLHAEGTICSLCASYH